MGDVIAQSLAATAVAGEGPVPVLVLALTDILLRHAASIHRHGNGIVDAPAGRLHHLVIIELGLHLEAILEEEGDVEDQALRTGQVDLHAGLAGQGAGLPEGGCAIGQSVMQRGQHIDMIGYACGGDVDLECVAEDGRIDIKWRRGDCAGGRQGKQGFDRAADRDIGPGDRQYAHFR